MPARTRCYPHGAQTPLLALARNARSHDPVLGPQSLSQWMAFWRPRVARYAAPYLLGMRRPTRSLAAVVEQALVSMLAELDTCPTTSDDALYHWVSVRTARTVLDAQAVGRTASAAARGRSAVPEAA